MLKKILDNTDFDIRSEWILEQIYALSGQKVQSIDAFKNADFLLNLFSIIHLKSIAQAIYENYDIDLETFAYNYKYLAKLFDVGFKEFALLKGFNYDDEDDFDIDEEFVEIIIELLENRYYEVISKLKIYYKNHLTMFEEIIKDEDFYENYKELAHEGSSLEDFSANAEIMHLYQWASDGFNFKGI